MAMVRKQVYIERAQDEKLKRLARRRGVTEAQIIRKAIDELDDNELTQREWEELLSFMKERAATMPRSDGGRTWTREELYDERPRYLSRRR